MVTLDSDVSFPIGFCSFSQSLSLELSHLSDNFGMYFIRKEVFSTVSVLVVSNSLNSRSEEYRRRKKVAGDL